MGVNHMKKLISTLLAACVLLSLAACGAAGTSPQADGTETYVSVSYTHLTLPTILLV